MERFAKLYFKEPALINNFVAAGLNIAVLVSSMSMELKGAVMAFIIMGLGVVTRLFVDSPGTAFEKSQYRQSLLDKIREMQVNSGTEHNVVPSAEHVDVEDLGGI